MYRSIPFVGRTLALSALAALASALSPVASGASASETVTIRTAELQNRADHYTELAAYYRKLASANSKHMITYFTAANRLDRLAVRSHVAALRAAEKG